MNGLLAAEKALEAELKEKARWETAREWAKDHPECCKLLSVCSHGFMWRDAAGNAHVEDWPGDLV